MNKKTSAFECLIEITNRYKNHLNESFLSVKGYPEDEEPLKEEIEYIDEVVKQVKEETVQLPKEDARIIRDMFTELISFDECEGHEEPPEYVYRLETQLSILIGDTTNAHMCWEESK